MDEQELKDFIEFTTGEPFEEPQEVDIPSEWDMYITYLDESKALILLDMSLAKIAPIHGYNQLFGVQIAITDVHNGQNCNAIFFSFTVSNQTDAPISANFLQTCQIQLDGKPFDAFTIQSMRATYQQFGQDVEDFSQPIPAGATVTGYIGAEVYEDYQEGVLLYSPLAGGSGDNQDDSKLISYTFHPDDLLDIESAPMQTAMPTESNS